MIYGKVTYVGEKHYYATRAHEGSVDEPDPEGGFLYEFTPQRAILPIHTRMDMEFFVQRPHLFEVELNSGKPVRQRMKAQQQEGGVVSIPSTSAGAPKQVPQASPTVSAPGQKKDKDKP